MESPFCAKLEKEKNDRRRKTWHKWRILQEEMKDAAVEPLFPEIRARPFQVKEKAPEAGHGLQAEVDR